MDVKQYQSDLHFGIKGVLLYQIFQLLMTTAAYWMQLARVTTNDHDINNNGLIYHYTPAIS